MYVNCGTCPSCLQEKAMNRTRRIRNNVSPDTMCVFFGLTYQNDFIPFIIPSDLEELFENIDKNSTESDGSIYFNVPYYRNDTISYKRVNKSTYYHSDYFRRYRLNGRYYAAVREPIFPCREDTVLLHFNKQQLKNYKHIVNHGETLGICLYKDIQNFFKRLRQNIIRKYGDFKYSYYVCSEYGAQSHRPHFHVLAFIPPAYYEKFKSAVCASWSFDDSSNVRKHFEIARNAAAYVSSYVNCSADIPGILLCKPFRPKHSYSQGFGVGLRAFSIHSLYDAFIRRDLHYLAEYNKNGTKVSIPMLYPQYVISRYCPKFKGYCNLTTCEVRNIAEYPSSLKYYASKCCLTPQDVHQYSTMLFNKQKLFVENGYTIQQFADMYSQIWTIRASNLYKDTYDDIISPTYFQKYDNIDELLRCDVDNPSLYDLAVDWYSKSPYETDVNKFPANVQRTQNYENAYYSYDKSKKVRNAIYSQFNKQL